MSPFDVKQIKPELEKVIDFLQVSLNQVRTSRATPSIVENVKVVLSGSEMTLKQLASISCPQSNQIMIQPWADEYIIPIEKAISSSNLGLKPIVDQKIIRITLPSLSEERRDDLSRLAKEKIEESRQTIRHWWDNSWSKVQEEFKNKEISEDDKFKFKDELHKLIEDYYKKIDEMKEIKMKEIKEK